MVTKLAFFRAFGERRCLTLADGFYDWQRYYIRLRNGRPFGFAGLWEWWTTADGQPIDPCTLIATMLKCSSASNTRSGAQ